MSEVILVIVVASVVLGLAIAFFSRPVAAVMQKKRALQAIRKFKYQREQLEARFFDSARTLGKPRDLRWVDCDWLPDVEFAWDKQSGLLTAFVAVNIRFEAVEGGDMEDVAAVGTIRDAAALFHYHRGQWGTGGRALFNMSPADALVRLEGQFEQVDQLTACIGQPL